MSVLVVPLKPVMKEISVVISTDNAIEEYFLPGQNASRLYLETRNCTWNTVSASSGIFSNNYWLLFG